MKLKILALLLCTITSINSYAGECSTLGFGKKKLSDNMKQIVREEAHFPVSSVTLANVAEFKEVIVIYDRKGAEGTSETGNRPDLESLEDTTGYAVIEFDLKTPLNQIPNIFDDIKTNFYCIKEKLIVTSVNGEIQILGPDNSVLATYQFNLEEGKNEIPYCDFNNIQEKITGVRVEAKSYDIKYSTTRAWVD